MRQAAPDPVTLEGGEGYGVGNGGGTACSPFPKAGRYPQYPGNWERHIATLPQEFLFQINNWGWKYYIFLSHNRTIL